MSDTNDLSAPAIAIYFDENGPTAEGTRRMKFETTAEAVRFVVEGLAVNQQVNASLVFDDGTFVGIEGIIPLYKALPPASAAA